MGDRVVAFVGGGSGGHVLPIKSLLDVRKGYRKGLDKQEIQCVWFGEKGQMEEQMAKEAGVNFVAVRSGKLRREGTLQGVIKSIFGLRKIIEGIKDALQGLKKYQVSILFCKGGYVSFPVVIAARILKIPIVVHESDRAAGLANKVAAKLASKRLVGCEGALPDSEYVGQIISDTILDMEVSGKKNKRTQVLVMGGSQGAQRVFEAVSIVLKQGVDMDMMDFHILLGTKNREAQSLFDGMDNVQCYGFLGQAELVQVYGQCDVSVTRGSITSLEEQLVFGLQLIIVPLPYTGGNHQYHNGLWYKQHENAQLLDQQDGGFEQDLAGMLRKYQGYKKPQNKDTERVKKLKKTKQRIWDILFG